MGGDGPANKDDEETEEHADWASSQERRCHRAGPCGRGRENDNTERGRAMRQNHVMCE